MPIKNKHNIPEDVKRTVISIVRGQERRRQDYANEYDDIMNGSSAPFVEYVETDSKGNLKQARAYLPKGKDNHISSTESKALALQKLNEKKETLRMKTVDEELNKIGEDIADIKSRRQLSNAIYLNCINRSYTYERAALPCFISRKKFYQYRNEFLYRVAKELELI